MCKYFKVQIKFLGKVKGPEEQSNSQTFSLISLVNYNPNYILSEIRAML